MLDLSCLEIFKIKKKIVQNWLVQRFWFDFIVLGVVQLLLSEFIMLEGVVVIIIMFVNMNVDSFQFLFLDGVILVVQQVMMVGQSEDEFVDSIEEDVGVLVFVYISGFVLENSDFLQQGQEQMYLIFQSLYSKYFIQFYF